MKFMLQHRLATPVIQPRMHFFDKEGKPLIGGKVYSFKVGEDIFKPTYRNSEFTAANQNPILLDQAGSALIYVRGSVQLKIYDKSGVFIEEKIVYQQQMRTQFFDKYGKALGGGKVWTYDYQSTIKKPSYENADDALLNPNPVILDENGWGSLSIVGAYRLRQYDKKGVFVGDQDFKRPPARVLTSVVYPVYTLDTISTNTQLSITKKDLIFNTESKVPTVQLESIRWRTIENEYHGDPECTAHIFSLNGLFVREITYRTLNNVLNAESLLGLTNIQITKQINIVATQTNPQNQSNIALNAIQIRSD